MLNQFSINTGSAQASNDNYVPSGEMTSTNVQNAIDELVKAANYNPKNYIHLVDDCFYSVNSAFVNNGGSPLGLNQGGSAGGGMANQANNPVGCSIGGRLGIAAFGTGAGNNATGQAVNYSDFFTLYPGQITSGAVLDFSIFAATLSVAGVDYVLELGFGLNGAVGSPSLSVTSMALVYNNDTSPQWQAQTSLTGTFTAITTASASFTVAANTWYDGRVVIGGATVSFYVAPSGSSLMLLGSSSSNLPTAAHPAYLQFEIFKTGATATTTSSKFVMDRVEFNGTVSR